MQTQGNILYLNTPNFHTKLKHKEIFYMVLYTQRVAKQLYQNINGFNH